MKCQICKKVEAEIKFCESVMDYTHGFTQEICKGCYKKILLDKKAGINKQLKELEDAN